MRIAIILSGGVGSRMGADIPKQYLEVKGKPIFCYALKTFAERKDITRIIMVANDMWHEYINSKVADLGVNIDFAEPGENRQHSIYNALKVIDKDGIAEDDIVIIHDAVRPLVSNKLIEDCFEACSTHDGSLPIIRVKDTIYLSENGVEIKNLLNRDHLFAGQSPESFNLKKYLKIHEEMCYDDIMKINGSTEIAYKSGLHIKLISGDEMNFKITTPEDLKAFEIIV